MTIGYKDLNSPFIAGQYSYKDKLIDVGQSQILDWETDPTIRFKIVHSYNNRYFLGEKVEPAA